MYKGISAYKDEVISNCKTIISKFHFSRESPVLDRDSISEELKVF